MPPLTKEQDNKEPLIQKLEAAAIALERFGPSPYLANACSEIAFFRSSKDRNAGLEAYRKAVDQLDRSPEADPAQKAFALKRWGALLLAENRLDEGVVRYREALMIERSIKADPFSISFTLSDLGLAARQQGRRQEALNYYTAALAIREQAHKKDPGDVRAKNSLANTLSYLAWGQLYLSHFLLRSEAPAEIAGLRQLLSSVRQTLERHPNPELSRELIPYAGLL